MESQAPHGHGTGVADSLREIGALQRESIDRLKAQEELGKKLEASLKDLAARNETTEKWLKDVEEKANKARFGDVSGNGPDQLLNVLDARHRLKIRVFESIGLKRNEAVLRAGLCAWLQDATKLQLARFSQHHAAIAQEMIAIQRALGDPAEILAAPMQEDTTTEGGFTVPTPLEAMVLRSLNNRGVVRPLVRKVPMTSKTLDWPAGDNAVTAAIIAEEGSITQTEETFTQKKLIAKKFAARGKASMELLQDSAVNLLDYYLVLASEKISLLEDDQALEGDGTGVNFTGVNAASGTNSQAAGGTNATLGAELGKVIFKGVKETRRNAAFVMHSQTAGHLTGVSDATGRPLLNTDDVGRIINMFASNEGALPSPDGVILGRPVYTSDEITVTAATPDTANVYFGNWRDGMIFGDRTGIDFAVSEHTDFATAQIQLRVIKRTAILVAIPSYFTKWTSVPSE